MEADHPRLTSDTRGRPNPLRVILDSRLSLAIDDPLVTTTSLAPLLVATIESPGDSHFATRKGELERRRVEILPLPAGDTGVSLPHLNLLLEPPVFLQVAVGLLLVQVVAADPV